MHFLGTCDLQLMIMKNHLMLIFSQSFCALPLGCLMEAHISRLLLSKGYVILNCLRQDLAFSWISLSNGTNRMPRGPHQIYMTALKSGLLIPPGTEAWTLMSEKLGGNVVLLDNELGSEKKHLSAENVYHLGTLDHTLHSSSVSKLTGIRWNDALKSNCWAIGYRHVFENTMKSAAALYCSLSREGYAQG